MGGMSNFGGRAPRLGKFSGGKSESSPGTKLQTGSDVRPKVGRNTSKVGPRVGRAVIGSNVTGSASGKIRAKAGPRGLMNRTGG